MPGREGAAASQRGLAPPPGAGAAPLLAGPEGLRGRNASCLAGAETLPEPRSGGDGVELGGVGKVR